MLFIKCNQVFVLPEPDGPIINILNGQSLRSEELFYLFLKISSKFNILYFNLNIPTKTLTII